ncbi:MAG: hypothetical protein R6U98_29260, partial [Pirellulaceae bacterium]
GENASVSDSVRSDLGQHSLEVECSDPSGNTGNTSENYQVKALEFDSLSSASSSFESLEEQFSVDAERGEMVESIDWELVYDGETVESFSESYSGSSSFSEQVMHDLPLVSSDGTEFDWGFRASVEVDEFDGNGTDSVDYSAAQDSLQNAMAKAPLELKLIGKPGE